MLRATLIFTVSIVISLLVAQLPIFPLISEMREITQDGESLSQVWSFVSLPEFYDSARFARSGWLETTWRNYLILAGVNYGGLAGVFWAVWNVLGRWIHKIGHSVINRKDS